jgi:hypothetical protein
MGHLCEGKSMSDDAQSQMVLEIVCNHQYGERGRKRIECFKREFSVLESEQNAGETANRDAIQ